MPSARHRTIQCARCSRTGDHAGRGICKNCWKLLRKANALDLYPARPVRGNTYRPRIERHEIDEVVVLRILSGEWRLRGNPAEKAEVCRRWVATGRSLAQLAVLTGWKVERYYLIRQEVA